MLSAKFLAFSLAAVSGSTDVGPVYLKCTFQYPNGTIENYFKIEEPKQKVTFGNLRMKSIRHMSATFEGDRIILKDWGVAFQINRKDLSIISYFASTMETKIGQCEYLPPPRRAL